MKAGWRTGRLDDLCVVDYGTRVVRKVHGGSIYPVYGGGGATFLLDDFNRESCFIVSRFAVSEQCVRFVQGRFFLNDSGLTVRPRDTKSLSQRYLDYLLLSLQAEIYSLCRGTAQRNLDVEAFRNLSLSFPILQEQQRIVELLDQAFEGIASAVVTAEGSLAGSRQLAWEHLARVFENAGSDWERETISRRVKFIDYRGKTPPKRPIGVRLITAKNVKMGFVQRHPEEFIEAAAYSDWMTRGFPQRGDVLFTTEAPLANVAQIESDEQVVIGQRLITMQPDRDRLDPSFLKYMLLSRPLQKAIRARATGATVQGIKASLLKQIEIVYPKSLNEQRQVVSKLDDIFGATSELQAIYVRKLAALAELKQSLLARAFSGELTREPFAA